MYVETYGNAVVRALTTASKAFYHQPPDGFSPHPLLTPRGALIVGDTAHHDALRQAWRTMCDLVPSIEWWEQAEILRRVPVLRPEAAVYAVHEPQAIHHGFLRGAKAAGMQLVCDAGVRQIAREDSVWCDELACLAGVAPIGPSRESTWRTNPDQPG